MNKILIGTKESALHLVLQEFCIAGSKNFLFFPINHGLINDTWRLENSKGENIFVLQRLNPIFEPSVNNDIAALSPILREAGINVPVLVKTRNMNNYLYSTDAEMAGCWRLMNYLEGHCIHRARNTSQIQSLAKTLAKFHDALRNETHVFQFSRGNVHNFTRHRQNLEKCLNLHTNHRLINDVTAFYYDWKTLCERRHLDSEVQDLPQRIIHGDPKISNFLFDSNDNVCAVLDLDTMARSSLDSEMGDALRSWCNAADENHEAMLNEDFLCTALKIYKENANFLTEAELFSLKRAPLRIAAELAARFAADALNESYFRHDPTIAPSHGEHALLRAKNQLSLALQFEEVLYGGD